jgi:hypothetical protein
MFAAESAHVYSTADLFRRPFSPGSRFWLLSRGIQCRNRFCSRLQKSGETLRRPVLFPAIALCRDVYRGIVSFSQDFFFLDTEGLSLPGFQLQQIPPLKLLFQISADSIQKVSTTSRELVRLMFLQALSIIPRNALTPHKGV